MGDEADPHGDRGDPHNGRSVHDLAPTPPSIDPASLVPEGSSDLFGPRSLRQPNGRSPSPYDDPPTHPVPVSSGSAHSWITWQREDRVSFTSF
jgi:hypothetical protein